MEEHEYNYLASLVYQGQHGVLSDQPFAPHYTWVNAIQAEVHSIGADTPLDFPREPLAPYQAVAMVMMIKDESDIILENLLWTYMIGISRADQSGVARALRRFSDDAMIAVLLVLGSGVFNSWMLVGSFSGLIWTSFGNALLVKLVLVVAMLGLAVFNRFSLVPALALPRDTALPRLQRNLVFEIILGAMVLAAASILGNLPPAEM